MEQKCKRDMYTSYIPHVPQSMEINAFLKPRAHGPLSFSSDPIWLPVKQTRRKFDSRSRILTWDKCGSRHTWNRTYWPEDVEGDKCRRSLNKLHGSQLDIWLARTNCKCFGDEKHICPAGFLWPEIPAFSATLTSRKFESRPNSPGRGRTV